MKALYCPYDFFFEGSFSPDLTVCLHTVLVTMPSCMAIMGLLGLISNHLVSFHIVSPGYGIVYTIGFYIIVLGGYYAKILALGLVVISWICFYIGITQVDWENHEGYALCVISQTVISN
jgi:hypothetical protein